MMKVFTLVLIVMQGVVPGMAQKIIDKPIVFDEQRRELSLQYLDERYEIKQGEPSIEPKMIVIHWTGINDLEESYKVMENSLLPSGRSDITTGGGLNVSAHYLVSREGKIFRLLPDTVFARHVIGLNHIAIGIENVGDASNPLTQAQLEANLFIINSLSQKFEIQYVIGHYEYQKFIGHPLWLEKDPAYLTEKRDPGARFMKKLRNHLQEHNFKPIPES